MAVQGTGLTITFSSGFFAEILSGKWTSIERESIDTSNMASTLWRTFIPGSLADAGQLEVELQFDPTLSPPIGGAAENVTVTYVDGSTWSASGFLVSFESEAPLENTITATATIKFSGAITVVGA